LGSGSNAFFSGQLFQSKHPSKGKPGRQQVQEADDKVKGCNAVEMRTHAFNTINI
jgi:hypothetical protein